MISFFFLTVSECCWSPDVQMVSPYCVSFHLHHHCMGFSAYLHFSSLSNNIWSLAMSFLWKSIIFHYYHILVMENNGFHCEHFHAEIYHVIYFNHFQVFWSKLNLSFELFFTVYFFFILDHHFCLGDKVNILCYNIFS